MSGIEVAGLVLGALPFVLSGLKFYYEGISTVKRYISYKRGLADLHRRISNEQSLFLDTCEKLLDGVVSQSEIEPLLKEPLGLSWQSADLKTRLRRRLGHSYKGFVDTVSSIHMAIKRIMEKMKLNRLGEVCFSDINAFEKEYKRLKFSIAKKDYDELYDMIRIDVSTLGRLTEGSITLEPSRRLRSDPGISVFRGSAKSIYDALCAGWKCSCKYNHNFNLHIGLSDDDVLHVMDRGDTKTPYFRILLCFDQHSSSTDKGWHQEETEVRTWTLDVDQMNAMTTDHKPKLVRFANVSVGPFTPLTASIAEGRERTTRRIENLCNEMTSIHTQTKSGPLGFIRNDETKMEHHFYTSKHQGASILSLSRVLTEKWQVNRKERLYLSVTIASSVLRLGQTQWLDDHWTRDQILFLIENGRPALQHPYIAGSLGQTPHETMADLQRSGVRNRSLFTLGILLIELWFGKTIEETCIGAGLNSIVVHGDDNIVLIDWKAMDILLDYLRGDAGDYAEVARVCICCDIAGRDKSFDASVFRDGVYRDVLVNLVATQKSFYKGSTI